MPRKLNYWPRFTDGYGKLNGAQRGFILRTMWERLGQMSQIDVLNVMAQLIAQDTPRPATEEGDAAAGAGRIHESQPATPAGGQDTPRRHDEGGPQASDL